MSTTAGLKLSHALKAEDRRVRQIGHAMLQQWVTQRRGDHAGEWTCLEASRELAGVVHDEPAKSWPKLARQAYYWFQTGELTAAGWRVARDEMRRAAIHRQSLYNTAAAKRRSSSAFAAKLLADAKPQYRCNLRGQAFYRSEQWQALRYAMLKRHGATCQACGASAKDGTEIHVDHILPRSAFPELALDPRNMQVLCRSCNMAKSNTDSTLWRSAEGKA